MADLKAQISISADASGVEAGVGKAKRSLADLGATAQTAGKQASDGLAKVGDGGTTAATKVDRATQNIIGSIQRTTAALDAGGRSSSAYYAVLAQQRGVDPNALKPYLDQLDAVAAKQKVAATAITSTIAPMTQIGMSARATSAALRQVPAQFTDIITSLQGGQAPLTVLLQQGGQLKDVFGGIGPAARALGGYVLGLVNPFTLAAAAAAALGVAYFQGSKESTEFAKAIILSGNAAGTTVGQLNAMAKSIGEVAGTQGAAAEALAALAASGQVAGQNLEAAAVAAIKFERTAGQAVSETVKQFEELGKAPVEASVKLNEKLNYLTLATYAQIKALQEQGREAEAAAAAQKAYADALSQRAGQIEQQLGTIERAWRGVKDGAKSAWDAMLNVGRSSSLQDQLAGAQKELEARQQRGPLNSLTGGAFEKGNQTLRDRIAILRESISMENRGAAAQKAAADQVKARVDFDKAGEQFTTNAVKMEREIAKARNEGAAAGATQAEIEKRIGDIRAKYTDKGAAKIALGIDKAQLGSDIDAIQGASNKLLGIFSNQQKVLEAQRSAGGVSDSDYYARRRELVIAEIEVEEYALQQQIKRFQQEKLSGKDAIDNARKIADAESKIAILRADASSKLEMLATQQDAAVKKLALAFLTARQAAQDYFDSVQRQQARDLTGQGQGVQTRARDAGINQIEDRYAGQRRDLENQKAQLELEGKFTDEARAQYDERLRIIAEFQAKSIESFTGYYGQLIEKQASWSTGSDEAFANYIDSAAAVAKQSEALFTNAFGGIEDALVKLGTTGKASFKDLANSILADIIRIQARAAIAGLLKYFNGAATTGSGASLPIGNVVGTPQGGAATGTNFVERDMLTLIHKGEAVIPKAYNPAANPGIRGQSAGGSLQVVMNNQNVQATAREEATTGPDGTQLRLLIIDAVSTDIASGTGRTGAALKSRMGTGPGVLPRRK